MTQYSLTAIGLGSNLGDRRFLLRRGVAGLGKAGELVGVSSLYETAPIGVSGQGPYLNAVALLHTGLSPERLLDVCLALEQEAGRTREGEERWAPRALDLDLLLYGGRVVDVEGLAVPHPRMTERRFVLEPLLEVWPEATLPHGTVLRGFLSSVRDQEVRPVEGPDWAS
ncbi:MAG: 2-amino-4-hydroxy-6-hydroxymethyldihydropteridine diphosphokinase [Acidimicrobiia bacterium]